MQWYELFPDGHEPQEDQIREYVDTALWDDLAADLQRTYNVRPKLFYSGCTMDKDFWKGWNVKYKKSGKALCTLYPKQGYFVALIAIGAKEQNETDLLMPFCDVYTKDLYGRTKSGAAGKSLAMEITNENVLRDAKHLIALRAGSRKNK